MIVFDVGANDGKDSLWWIGNRGATVHAFEPAPAMLAGLRAHESESLIVVPAAVSDYNGKATFYLSELSDHGCSSLYRFRDNLHQTWPGRGDLQVTRRVRVDVIRLDTYMERAGVEHIDFLHIDAQGADLAVLRGLGNRYLDVAEGKLEVAVRRDVALYQGVPTLDEVRDWLHRHGFEVTGEESNDQHGNEVNVTFRRAT